MYIFNQGLFISFIKFGIEKLVSQTMIVRIIIITSFIINNNWVFKKTMDFV